MEGRETTRIMMVSAMAQITTRMPSTISSVTGTTSSIGGTFCKTKNAPLERLLVAPVVATLVKIMAGKASSESNAPQNKPSSKDVI